MQDSILAEGLSFLLFCLETSVLYGDKNLMIFSVHFFAPPKKEPNLPAGRQEKESLHEAIAAHHSLPQLHACSPFQSERTSVVPFIIAGVQRLDPINDFGLKEYFSNLQSQIFNLKSLPAGRLNLLL
ncbi:hypothetical protein QWY87_09370 [Lutimonas halocynthiae]|uniref:hypothetical protein n=1 Tax=Lutimonas halocynthiae TaxID=1446477 RepID=UPI0025B2BC31|nr:hypothetical protein [Lutimonas halocynthiae]MDN3642908.1 hypothetical protein [Lutimonas halocynthiae]